MDSFIAVAGFKFGDILNGTVDGTQIYQLKWNCSRSSECEYSDWQEMEQKLMLGRSHTVAMMIPDKMTNCEPKQSFHVSDV